MVRTEIRNSRHRGKDASAAKNRSLDCIARRVGGVGCDRPSQPGRTDCGKSSGIGGLAGHRALRRTRIGGKAARNSEPSRSRQIRRRSVFRAIVDAAAQTGRHSRAAGSRRPAPAVSLRRSVSPRIGDRRVCCAGRGRAEHLMADSGVRHIVADRGVSYLLHLFPLP